MVTSLPRTLPAIDAPVPPDGPDISGTVPGRRRPQLLRVPAKYELLRVLGSGGMGTVALARDRRLGRLVALKFLRESCLLFLERFDTEARLMARLQHPSIVPIFELDRFEGRTFLAMGYVGGGNLAQARLRGDALVRTLRPVVDALGFVHDHGIVHSDVKPENVLLDTNGRALLGDFGLALGPGEGARGERARPVGGTPLAMSPEQARGEALTPASDLFSFGSTLYRELVGRWPFRGRTLPDLFLALEEHDPEPLRAIDPRIPASLERVVLRCLEKNPADRFGSMDELGRALDRHLKRRSFFGFMNRRPEPLRAKRGIHPEDQR